MVAAAVEDDVIVSFSGFRVRPMGSGLARVLIDTLSVYVPGPTMMMTLFRLISAIAALIVVVHPSVTFELTHKIWYGQWTCPLPQKPTPGGNPPSVVPATSGV